MKLKVICFLLIGLFIAGCAALQKDPNDPNNLSDKQIKAYNDDPNNKDKIVCEEQVPIGSNIPVRNCHKESVLDWQAQQSQQAVREAVRDQAQQPVKR